MTEKTPICNGCKKEREAQNKLPLQLVEVSPQIFGDPEVKMVISDKEKEARPLFKDHSIPLYLCKHCDAQELEAVEKILSQAG
jgi:hypothetical protein